ncbi:MerR family transcriptional regulator [Floccifex sp.]|uniref:MerR family transcriptional regulator n=1 Tax=Floccifex sp. TaxID=2815810 RepID=UPI003F1064C3
MLKIGDFSRLSRVSVRMLRYYDDMNLIKPVQVHANGYRYYDESQLLLMTKIKALKDMGFSLARIQKLIESNDMQEWESFFCKQREELLLQIQEMQYRLQLLNTSLEKIRKDNKMKYSCCKKIIPKRNVASVRQIIPSYQEEGKLWHLLFQELQTMPCGSCMAILHDKEYREEYVDVEVQVEVKECKENTEHIVYKTEKEITVASITFKGSYSQFSEVIAYVVQWICDNGFQMSGPIMNIYHVGPDKTQNPDEFVTEICCPI